MSVTIKGVTATCGSAQFGSNIAQDGGIVNHGTLTLKATTVSGNTAFNGGGIYNDGTLTLNDSTVSNNTAYIFIGHPPFGGYGGGIFNDGSGTVTLNDSAVSGNTPDDCVGC